MDDDADDDGGGGGGGGINGAGGGGGGWGGGRLLIAGGALFREIVDETEDVDEWEEEPAEIKLDEPPNFLHNAFLTVLWNIKEPKLRLDWGGAPLLLLLLLLLLAEPAEPEPEPTLFVQLERWWFKLV